MLKRIDVGGSLLTCTDQKFSSFALSSLWNCMLGPTGFTCRSKAVVFTAFCSSLVSFAKLPVKVSAIRDSVGYLTADPASRFLLICIPHQMNHGVVSRTGWRVKGSPWRRNAAVR